MATKGKIEIAGKPFEISLSDETFETITDRGGNSLQYLLCGGVLYNPVYKRRYISQLKPFPLRKDDVYFSGYPRSGTHWTFEMMSMLLNGSAETIARFKEHLELVSPEDFEKLASPRIINTHARLSDGPEDLISKKVKIVYTLRDPKDVVVSLYHAYHGIPWSYGTYRGSFGDFLDLFLNGKVDINGYLDHLRNTEKFLQDNPEHPIYFQVYEDTIKDPLVSLEKLSDFLEVKKNERLWRDIAEKCKFSRMKVDKEDFAFKMDGENFLYRKGQVGDWRNYFTEKMLEDYYRVYEEKMAGSRFYQRYSRDKDCMS